MAILRAIASHLPLTSKLVVYLAGAKLVCFLGFSIVVGIQKLPPDLVDFDTTTNWILGLVIAFGLAPPALVFYFAVQALSHFSIYLLALALAVDIARQKMAPICFMFPAIVLIGAVAWTPWLRTNGLI